MGDIWSPHNHFLPCFKGIKEGNNRNLEKKKQRREPEKRTRKEEKRKEKGREGRDRREEEFLYFHAVLIICSDQGVFMV